MSSFGVDSCRQNASSVVEHIYSSSHSEDVGTDSQKSTTSSAAAAAAVARSTNGDVEEASSSVAMAEHADIHESSSAADADAQQTASESLQSSGLDLDQVFVVVDLVLQLVADLQLSLHSHLVHVDLTGLVLDRVLVLVHLLGVRLKLLFVDVLILAGRGDLETELSDGSFVGVDAGESDLDQTVEVDDLVVVLAQQSIPLQNTSLD